MTLKFYIKNLECNFSDWKMTWYYTTDNSSVPGAIYRSMIHNDGRLNTYLPFFGGDDIGIYLSLTDPQMNYKAIGSGALVSWANAYNLTYDNPSYELHDLEKFKLSIDDFLLKASKLLIFI